MTVSVSVLHIVTVTGVNMCNCSCTEGDSKCPAVPHFGVARQTFVTAGLHVALGFDCL